MDNKKYSVISIPILVPIHLIFNMQAGSRLRIPNVGRSDIGRYLCTDGSRTQHFEIVIDGKIPRKK